MVNFLKKSLLRQFAVVMVAILSLIILGGILISILYQYERNQFDTIRAELIDKEEIMDKIERHYTLMVFRGRGYMAFRSGIEYKEIFEEERTLEGYLKQYRSYHLNSEEVAYSNEVEGFIKHYTEDFLPEVANLVRNREYEALGELTQRGTTDEINKILELTQGLSDAYATEIKTVNNSFIKKLSQLALIFFIYIIVILVSIGFAIRKIVRDIGKPLGKFTETAQKVSSGEQFEFFETNRNDEIGVLSRSFETMVRTVQMKEEELTAQNEELTAQQEELTAQQEQLMALLEDSENSKRKLELYNDMISTLSTTLNQKELLEKVVTAMTALFHTDKAMLVLLNDHSDYKAIGISEENAKNVLSTLKDGVQIRLEQTKKIHVSSRISTSAEQGYHQEPVESMDLYAPVFTAEGTLIAIYMSTRIGYPFSERDIEEHQSLMSQLALSIEKIYLYEEAEKERQLNQDIIDNVNEGIILVDSEGQLVQVNYKLCELFDRDSVKSLFNLPLQEWILKLVKNVENKQQFMSFFEQVTQNTDDTVATYRYEILYPEKKVIDVYAQAIYRNEEKIGTLFVHRDITVEHGIDGMKSELVSTVSHELRTPLASILGFTELMINKDLNENRKKKYLDTIHKEAKRLTNLINDFLDLQRMESGKQTYHKKAVNMGQLIEQISDIFNEQHLERKILITDMTSKAVVFADEEKMVQLFTNLISNAIKFSPDGDPVELELKNSDFTLEIAVKDSGLGIPETEIKNLFQKFYRIDNSDRRKIGGTGLGLSVCKEIAQAHDGTISVISTEGQGSTFTVTLPLVQGEEYIIENPKVDESKPKLLILEDDQSLALLLKEQLLESGFQVVHKKDGEEAIKAIESFNPDAVVIDIMLHNSIDGWTVIEKLKENPKTKNIPIIVSSALDEKDKGFQLGAKHYLTKPYPANKLSTVILQTLLAGTKDGQIMYPDVEGEQ
ncbi:ATP-binding protein [Bacillus alkalicellulosilyticus]|uniref:ATP-binding protein n=1 Tax=Alkalihalobacterium alkalicellulosilyticum TaxID=1912214 RepID=UPI0009960B5B|nr:ATP-binding protein [Bacillus alkalicellulosilyticus]